MSSKFIPWRSHTIHVTDAGEGTPLMLINGLGGNTDMWLPFMEHFTDRRVICFDAPGTGQSTSPLSPVSVASLAELAGAVLEACTLPQADVVGYSYGGAIAQQLAYDAPAKVRRLVLAATTCGVGAIPGSVGAMGVLATPLRYYSSSYFDRTAAAAYGGLTARDSATRRRMMAVRRRHPPSWHGYAMQMLGGASWSSWSFLSHIEHETLVISGDDDPLVPVANPKMLANRIPRARLEIVKNAGHLMLWDDVENLAKRISNFVNAAPGRNKLTRLRAARRASGERDATHEDVAALSEAKGAKRRRATRSRLRGANSEVLPD
jgi:pimeloyl-ACP methyl ester carboxylesterase